MVAEYAIWLAQQRNQRVIYTTPLKALSNQKYRDLGILYGLDAVGLVTGDIVEHSRASIVIMTTEVYRNMLLEEGADRFVDSTDTSDTTNIIDTADSSDGTNNLDSLDSTNDNISTGNRPSLLANVGFVVFDELHYLSDAERGPVWEEAIVCSPPHVQLVGLSATVSNADELAQWISRVHRPISLVVHEQRAVPLEHYYFLDNKLHLVQDADGNRIERFPRVGGEARLARMMVRNRSYTYDDEDEEEDEAWEDEAWERRNRRRKARQQPFNGNAGNRGSQNAPTVEEPKLARPPERKAPQPGEILAILHEHDMLPCLYFLPGRRVVEEGAMSAALHQFTSPEEQVLIQAEVDSWLQQLSREDRSLQQVHDLTRLLPRGLAFHHAGLLPGLKMLVETLFQRGYLRAVFATDTLSLGVNMPARSVVVGSLSKFDGQEMRLLTPNEYRQLTGRAGRRGMDVRGAAIIPYSPWEPFEDSFQRITGELLPVTSSFVIRYNSVLNLWRPGDVQHLRRICASSLREYQRYIVWEQRELARLEKLELRYSKGRKENKKRSSQREGATQSLERRRKIIGAYPLSRAGAAELDGTIFALRVLGYIGQDDKLTLKGRLLRSIFHPSGVLIIELMMAGALDNLSAGELSEVCSWFTFDNERRLNNRDQLNNPLMQVRRELWRIVQHVRGIEDRANITMSHGIVPDFHGIALAWARNMSLNGLLRRIDLAEGDLLMVLNQTIDLVQQVQSAIGQAVDARDIWEQGTPAMTDGVLNERNAAARARERSIQLETQRIRLTKLRPLLAQASRSLLHGIILQSRTVPSMAAHIDDEEVQLNPEVDAKPREM